MKIWVALLALVCVVALSSGLLATEPSKATLSEMGIGGMRVMADAEGMQVRGMATFAVVQGISTTAVGQSGTTTTYAAGQNRFFLPSTARGWSISRTTVTSTGLFGVPVSSTTAVSGGASFARGG